MSSIYRRAKTPDTSHRARRTSATWRRVVAALAVTAVALVAAGCSRGDRAETTSSPVSIFEIESAIVDTDELRASEESGAAETTSAPTKIDESTGSTADGESDGDDGPLTVEIMAIDQHPSGIQAQLRSLTFDDGATEAAVRYINGREFDTNLYDDHATQLIAADGTAHDARGIEDFELPESALADYSYQFPEVDPEDGPFLLRLNYHADDEGRDEHSPGFEIGPIDALSHQAPVLPAGFGLTESQTHESGASVRLDGIGFSDDSIGVAFVISNNGRTRANFANGRLATWVEDDLGNRYPLELGPDTYQLRVEDGESLVGTMVFAGRVHPDATAVSVMLNTERDTNNSNPAFRFGPYPISGGVQTVGLPETISVDESYSHPNGTDFSLRAIEFGADGSTVRMLIENDRAISVGLALTSDGTVLRDDVGNDYPVLPPADNRGLEVAGDTSFDAVLSFPGTIDPLATTIEVVINDGQDAGRDLERSGFPEAHFGPYPITRGAAAASEGPSGFGSVSQFGADVLDRSEGDAAALVFDEFNGVEVEGGVLLTLPEAILFDSGESVLRSGAGGAIAKVALIMEYYAGDQVIVIGHTDDRGSDDYNQELSEARAASVVAALAAAGADVGLVRSEGRGETEPVADNGSASGQQANRRVEIMVETTKGLPA